MNYYSYYGAKWPRFDSLVVHSFTRVSLDSSVKSMAMFCIESQWVDSRPILQVMTIFIAKNAPNHDSSQVMTKNVIESTFDIEPNCES